MCKECVPSVPVDRLLGRSGFGNSFGSVKDDASYNIQDIISLGSGLMWSDADVCGGRMGLKILIRELSEMWESLGNEYDMMFADPWMCWECRETLLVMRVHTNHRDTIWWSYSLTGSDEAFYIQHSTL